MGVGLIKAPQKVKKRHRSSKNHQYLKSHQIKKAYSRPLKSTNKKSPKPHFNPQHPLKYSQDQEFDLLSHFFKKMGSNLHSLPHITVIDQRYHKYPFQSYDHTTPSSHPPLKNPINLKIRPHLWQFHSFFTFWLTSPNPTLKKYPRNRTLGYEFPTTSKIAHPTTPPSISHPFVVSKIN